MKPSLVTSFALAAGIIATPSFAQDFRDKTIRVIVGSAPGGGHDAYARLVSRHLAARLPGRPQIVVSNMPGASSVQAANYVYEIAPKDGTVIGTFNRATPFYEVSGQSNVRYRAKNFSWLASLAQSNDAFVAWHTAGVKNIDDAKRVSIVMGALTKIGTMHGYPTLLNATIGTKFKVVTGYESGTQVNLAMEKGEVQGRGSNPWGSYKAINPEWVAARKIIPLVQVGLRKEHDLPDVPMLSDLALNEDHRKMFDFVSATAAVDIPFAAPPNLPPEVLKSLREAFESMMADRAFQDDAAKANLELEPMSGETLGALVARIIDTPRDVVERANAIMTGDAAK